VHIVCANVGVGEAGTFETSSIESFRRILEVNVVGTLRTVTSFLPLLRSAAAHQQPASILITGSEHSLGVPPYVQPLTAYTTSKHALLGLAACMRRDLAGEGIGVSLLAPSYVATERLRSRAETSAAAAEILADMAQEPSTVARRAFDGIDRGDLVIPTNQVSAEFVVQFHRSIIDAMEQVSEGA